jgi:hypothetical protein
MRMRSHMRGLRSVLATMVLMAGVVGVDLVTAPAASANGPCHWITTDSAYVRENPSINSVVRKTVPANYVVSGPNYGFCRAVTGTDGRAWVAVDCLCATDDIGYIIENKLIRLQPA